jgi:soluble lytic murein transglycosylase-like protein
MLALHLLGVHRGYRLGPIGRVPGYDMAVHANCMRHDVDPALVYAIIEVESGYNQRARSRARAYGLMQLTYPVMIKFRVRAPYDPNENIRAGVAHLRELLDFFHQDVVLTLAAYNAGRGAVQWYKGVPPFRETKRYVKKVMRAWRASAAG